MRLTFVNVGYGEAMVVECPDPASRNGRFVMVIDGGGNEVSEFADRSSGRVPMAEYLAGRGLDHIDVMVSTHIHEDHLCGLLPMLEHWTAPGAVADPAAGFYHQMRTLDVPDSVNASQSKFLRALNDYGRICALVEARGGVIRTITAPAVETPCRDLSVHVLAPDARRAEELRMLMDGIYTAEEGTFWPRLNQLDARMNNFSLILRLDYCGTRLLLPGDTNCLGYDGL